jgi:SAM-dependent methyltransferase
LFADQGAPLVQCLDCGLILRNPPPTDVQFRAPRGIPASPPVTPLNPPLPRELQRRETEHLLDQIEGYARNHGRSVTGAALLQIGGSGDELIEAARTRGIQATGMPAPSSFAKGSPQPVEQRSASFDVCVVTDGFDRSQDPTAFMEWVYSLLTPGGILAVTVPNLDSWPARMMGSQWDEFHPDRRFYFNWETSRSLLFRSGFAGIVETLGGPPLNFRNLLQSRDRMRSPRFLWLLRLAFWLIPGVLRLKLRAYGRNEITLLAQRSAQLPPCRRRHKLSVVLPLFNEAKTFRQVMDALLAKPFEDMDLEVIVVESNSTDGSREAALDYQSRPGVKVILEDRPQGKGHAVRNGLANASGDFIIIQDADLEYDLDDYDDLLLPLRHYRKAFVLGSRHSGNVWKIRHFEGAVATSSFLNAGHVFFTLLFNVLYRQRLKDPFTMYKVFWRECLHDIAFESNRFDFDCELVAKLVRRGYRPIEIPVNYTSRSFAEGKKISIFRDPPTYLRAFLKYRFVNLDKEKARERAALQHA